MKPNKTLKCGENVLGNDKLLVKEKLRDDNMNFREKNDELVKEILQVKTSHDIRTY